MAALSQELIDEIVRRVLTVCQPDKIILFGSAARGDMGPDSDIDLLVVAPEVKHSRKEGIEIRGSLNGLGQAFDIFVITTAYMEEMRDIIGSLAYPAAREGRVIYARH